MPAPAEPATDASVGVLLAPGFEEVEALAVVDALFRAGVRADLVSVEGTADVVSSHGVRIGSDLALDDADLASYAILFLPGGMPGTTNLSANPVIGAEIDRRARAGLPIAAICAAPLILAERGHLAGRTATANPGFMSVLEDAGAHTILTPVALDGPIITSRGAGTALELGIALVALLRGEAEAERVATALVHR